MYSTRKIMRDASRIWFRWCPMVYYLRRSTRRQQGFTLIELLVAIAILALVAVMGWRGLDGIVRARVAITADMESTRRLQLTFAQLQSDCAQTVGIQVLNGRQAVMANDGQLTLTRTIDADNQPLWFEVVTYRIVNDTLTRSESAPTRDMRVLEQMWNSALQHTDHDATVNLLSNISSMKMRVWQDDAWIPAAAGDLSAGTPSGVEIQMKVSDHQTPIVKALLMGAR
jgi:general secretion pathway protein J